MILRHVLLHLIVFMNAFICMKAEKFVNSNVLQATNSMKTNQNSLNSKEKINSQSSSIASSKKSKLLTSNSLNIRRKEKSKETEQLYEAYNLLHSLAQVCHHRITHTIITRIYKLIVVFIGIS